MRFAEIFLKKLESLFFRIFIYFLWLSSAGKYKLHMPLMLWWLRRKGVKFLGRPIYIAATTSFDGGGYELITIGDRVVISGKVVILVHDYSISRALEATGRHLDNEIAFVRPVFIGNNSFIGRSTIILPGSHIGNNVIVGAGSVIRGKIPDDSVVIGNPAQVVGNTIEYAEKHAKYLGTSTSRIDG